MATEGTLSITGSGDNAIYELQHTTSASGDYKALLNTKNTFVDKNISITITTPAIGAQTLDIENRTTDLTWGSSSGTADSKTFSPTATLTGTVTPATAGWATTAAANVSETGVIVGKVPQIKVGITATSTNIKVTPTIARTVKPANDTWVDAASGAAVTTKPTSGVYVQVNAAAKAGSTTVTGKVSTAGYGTTSDYAADSATTITGGTNAAANTYVPIKVATLTTSDLTATFSGPTYDSDSGKFVIAASGTTATTITNEGYISSEAGNIINGTISGTKNLDKIKVGVTPSTTSSKVTPVIKRTAKSSGSWIDAASGAEVTSATAGQPYVQVNAAAVAASLTVTGKVSAAGYGTTTSGQYSTDTATTITTGSNAAATKYIPITTASPTFDGGELTGSSEATATNATLNSTNGSGILIQTKYSASRAAVLYNGAVEGWVSKSDDAEALAAGSLSLTNGTAYYISAVTIPSGKSLSITNNGTATMTTTGTANITSTGTTTVTSNSTTAGKITIAAKTAAGDSSNTSKEIVTNGLWKTTTITANTSAAQTAYGRVVVNKLTAGTIAAVTSDPGTSYTENTSVVLASGGWLRLTAGYYTATKISLATLVPNGSNIAGYANYLLEGYSAYDNDGKLVTGSMPIYNGSYTVT